MSENFWYVANENEILVDMDKPEKSLPHAEMRLWGAIEYGKLNPLRVEIHDSNSPDHIHAMITLNNRMEQIERIVWGVMLHSDIYRALVTIMRWWKYVPAPDLLITPIKFLRPPDDTCWCETKHDAKTMERCPAAIRLRGDKRTEAFFGLPIKNIERILTSYVRNENKGNQIWENRYHGENRNH